MSRESTCREERAVYGRERSGWERLDPASVSGRGLRIALCFALLGERLTNYYEHGQWLTEAQGASLCAEWLARSRRSLPLAERRQLSAVSDELARQIAASLSREAGLQTAHEMMEALDPSHHSEIGQIFMAECERRLDELPGFSSLGR